VVGLVEQYAAGAGGNDPVDEINGIGVKEVMEIHLAAGQRPTLLTDRVSSNFNPVDRLGSVKDVRQVRLGLLVTAALLDELAQPRLAAESVEELSLLRLGR